MVQANLTGRRARHVSCSLKGMMPITTRTLGGAALLSLTALASSQTDIAMTEAYTCDANGTPSAVRVGDSFYVGARFQVTGTPNSNYKFRVEMPYYQAETARLSFGTAAGSFYVFWGPVPSLTSSSFKIKATLDPERKVRESNRTNNVREFSVNPVAPSSPIEYFNAKSLRGRLGLNVSWRSGSAVPTEVTTWMPVPGTETFQQANGVSMASANSLLDSQPFSQTIAENSFRPSSLNAFTVESSISTVARSARANLIALRSFGNRTDASQAGWLAKEDYVELNRPEIRQWLNQTVSPFQRSTMSAAEIAEALYRSILKRCRYEFRAGAAPSAYQAARSKRGDCGALSSLFVALCRAAGIPARTVNGFAAGTNNWHIWAEFHVNGAGWVPVDPAYAEGKLASGSDLPIYFGVIPELNERVATGFGLDREIGARTLPMLQSPAVFWTGNNVRLNAASAFSSLTAE